MTITKVVAPIRLEVVWDNAGNVTGAAVTYLATFTDGTTGTVATITKGPIGFIPGQSFLNAMAAIYAAFPSSGL